MVVNPANEAPNSSAFAMMLLISRFII
jgi:hypothetical protein